jgi:hypothetical protein
LYVNSSDNHIYYKNSSQTWDLTEGGSSRWTEGSGLFMYPAKSGEAVSIGKTTNGGYPLDVYGSIFIDNGKLYLSTSGHYLTYVPLQGIKIQTSGTTNNLMIYQGSGNLVTGATITAANFILNSSRKLKKDISEISGLSKFDKIKIVQFKFKNDITGRLRYGVIADDIKELAPELVYRSDDNTADTVAYIDLLVAKIARLEQQIKNIQADYGMVKNFINSNNRRL